CTVMNMPADGMVPGAVSFIAGTHTAIVTSDSGIFQTTDFGTSWTPIGVPVGFDGSDVSAMSIVKTETNLAITMISAKSGVASYYEGAIPKAVHSTPALAPLVLSVTPNPIANFASITFSMPAREYARLIVSDPLGREVAVLADGILEGP